MNRYTATFLTPILLMTTLAFIAAGPAPAADIQISVDTPADGKAISPLLMGIFYEDLSHAADGGLYAELVQNRSFEYSAADHDGWHSLTAWERVQRGDGSGVLITDSARPLHPSNPNYAMLGVKTGGEGVGLVNAGFDGIPVQAGERYDFSVFARQMSNANGSLAVRLEATDGEVLAEAGLPELTGGWAKYSAVLEPSRTENDARLVVLARHPGRIGLDMVSLFPRKTFKDRPNGLRADLAQTIADLHPRFVRFPGGCLVHGDGLDNLYDWKGTIGPLETRKAQRNIWRYHQTTGLGYFEYFQFCEDLGAEPLPVVPAGVCCQNSGAGINGMWGEGQKGIPMEDMPAYVQDVLDLIEWANGPATSEWGAKRAAAGHPEPFGLKYLGVGNEDRITPVFKERFRMIFEAVKARHPEIVVIGTVGPFPDGEDYDKGWVIADELGVPIVDEHYYRPPQWFWDNLRRYDGYDRDRSKVYAGEYAAHDDKRRATLRSALAEAAYLTSLERNGDVVVMASYAPLLARRHHTNWNPDLIYFTGTEISPTINYHVQKLFGENAGDRYLASSVAGLAEGTKFAFSAVRESASGDIILKLVNGEGEASAVRIELGGAPTPAVKTVLSDGDPLAANDYDDPNRVLPRTAPIDVGPAFDVQAPPYSLTVIRIPRFTAPENN